MTTAAVEKGLTYLPSVRVEHGVPANDQACVVVEEPLEIRVAEEAVALTMRTPGDDRFLALGFLFAEGVIASLDDVGSIYHCGRTDDPRYGNVIEVVPGPGARLDLDALSRSRRVGITTSACGVCGRDGIDDLLTRVSPVAAFELTSEAIVRAPERLRSAQLQFTRTGGLHAAAALDPEGRILAAAEDVGRHNAVDKVVGKLLAAGLVPRTTGMPTLLAVSGRASFEIIQKAAAAGFTGVASVSAPSSLAVATADALGLVLASFVREGRFTVYAHAERVSGCAPAP